MTDPTALHVPRLRRADAIRLARAGRLHARFAADAQPRRGRPHRGAGAGRGRHQGLDRRLRRKNSPRWSPGRRRLPIPNRDHMLAVGDRAFKAGVLEFLGATASEQNQAIGLVVVGHWPDLGCWPTPWIWLGAATQYDRRRGVFALSGRQSMAQYQAKPALDTVDPVWARVRREAEEVVQARAGTRDLHLFDHSASRHARSGDRLSAGGTARPCRDLGRIDPAGLYGCAQGHPVARRELPRRSHGDRRPRSGNPPADRAGALLQGFPRHPNSSAGALALGQGPPRFRPVLAKPLVVGLPVRHPSGRADRPRNFSRSRHRPRGRRNRRDRGRCVDPARRDTGRHRQGRATVIRKSATA